MKTKTNLFVLAAAAAMASVWTANATITSIADPTGTVGEIGARIRWGGNGFEASLYDSNPFGQAPTLNPAGTPVWTPVSGAAHKFQVTFDSISGLLGLSVDFDRSGTFGTGESISKGTFAAPGQTSYVGYGFKYLSISGNESGSAGRSSVGNLVINGTSLPGIAPLGTFLENFYKDSTGNPITSITITGELDFTVAGTSQERPSWNFILRDAATPVPEPSTYAAAALLVLPVLLNARRMLRRRS